MVEPVDKIKARLSVTREEIVEATDSKKIPSMVRLPGVSLDERAALETTFRENFAQQRREQLGAIDQLAQSMGIEPEESSKD